MQIVEWFEMKQQQQEHSTNFYIFCRLEYIFLSDYIVDSWRDFYFFLIWKEIDKDRET